MMNSIEEASQVQHILKEIDRLIAEMTSLKNQVANLTSSSDKAIKSIREAEFFGMWADREDIKGQTSKEWLDQLRRMQWGR